MRMRTCVDSIARGKMEKEVLVLFGERKRPVRFKAKEDPIDEKASLISATRDVFKDVLGEQVDANDGQAGPNDIILQIKSEKWSGEFVDLHGSMGVADGSVLRMTFDTGTPSPSSSSHEVCNNLG